LHDDPRYKNLLAKLGLPGPSWTKGLAFSRSSGKWGASTSGNGGALVFRTNTEAPALCALEVSKALKSYPNLHVLKQGIDPHRAAKPIRWSFAGWFW